MEPATEKKFEIHRLIVNMRLERLKESIAARVVALDVEITDVNTEDTQRERLIVLRDSCKSDYDKQVAYAKMLIQIGNGEVNFNQHDDPNIELIDHDEMNHLSRLCISNITTFTQINRDAITEDYLQDHLDLMTAEDFALLAECNLTPDMAKSIKIKNDLLQSKFELLAGRSKRVALDELYPGGFDADVMQKRTILATTNKQVREIANDQ